MKTCVETTVKVEIIKECRKVNANLHVAMQYNTMKKQMKTHDETFKI